MGPMGPRGPVGERVSDLITPHYFRFIHLKFEIMAKTVIMFYAFTVSNVLFINDFSL